MGHKVAEPMMPLGPLLNELAVLRWLVNSSRGILFSDGNYTSDLKTWELNLGISRARCQ